jgi:hypothetical protein
MYSIWLGAIVSAAVMGAILMGYRSSNMSDQPAAPLSPWTVSAVFVLWAAVEIAIAGVNGNLFFVAASAVAYHSFRIAKKRHGLSSAGRHAGATQGAIPAPPRTRADDPTR